MAALLGFAVVAAAVPGRAALTIEWTNTYNGATNGNDGGGGITVDGSGNVYVVGFSSNGSGNADIWVRKYDPSGLVLWTTTHNSPDNLDDVGNGIAADGIGNVYVVGYSSRTGQSTNIWVRKYDPNGLVSWTTTYNSPDNDADNGIGIAVDGGGNAYVTGSEKRTGTWENIWVRKYDTNGLVLWSTTYNSPDSFNDEGYGIAVDTSKNVYVTGYEYRTGQSLNIWVRKYDPNGLALWTTTYNSPDNLHEVGNGIAVNGSGNVYVTGYSTRAGQGANIWVTKYDSDGLVLWTTTYNSPDNLNDEGWSIAVDASGNVYVTGYETRTGQSSNIWLRKYDTNGLVVWTTTYNSSDNDRDMGNFVAVDGSGNVYVAGSETRTGQGWNIWVRKWSQPAPAVPGVPVVASVSPLGSRNTAAVSVMVTGSNFGGLVKVELLTEPVTVLSTTSATGTQIVAIIPAGLPVGVYQIRVTASGGATTSGNGLTFSVLLDETQAATVVEQTTATAKVVVEVPAGAFSGPVAITISATPVTVSVATKQAADAAARTGTGVILPGELDETVREIRALDATGAAVNPVKEVTVIVPYNKGTVKASQVEALRVVRLNPLTTTWELAAPYGRQTVDKAAGVVRCPVSSFSLFRLAVAAQAAAALDGVKMYDNPVNLGVAGTLVRWKDLTANATIDIYDASGERVILMEPGKSGSGWTNAADITGRATWDGKNADGQTVARGMYYVVVTDGSQRKVMKLAVVR